MSFPHLLEKNSGGEYPSDKYELTLLIPKSEDIKPLEAALLEVAKQAFPGKVNSLSDLSHNPIGDGDAKELDGYKGCWIIKGKSKFRPGIVGPDVQPLLDPQDAVYGGSYARMSLKPLSYLQAGRPGVTWALQNVQWLGHGERFGGGSRPENDFDQIQDEDGIDGQPNL